MLKMLICRNHKWSEPNKRQTHNKLCKELLIGHISLIFSCLFATHNGFVPFVLWFYVLINEDLYYQASLITFVSTMR